MGEVGLEVIRKNILTGKSFTMPGRMVAESVIDLI